MVGGVGLGFDLGLVVDFARGFGWQGRVYFVVILVLGGVRFWV